MLEVGFRRLQVVGTGFYVTRYGLFVTAKHVLEPMVDFDKRTMKPSFVFHIHGDGGPVIVRPIVRAHLLLDSDLGVAQAGDFVQEAPVVPMINLRASIGIEPPVVGSRVLTYAYPENATLDFNNAEPPQLRGDFYEGAFLGIQPANALLPFPHYNTSINLKSGASGGPVFDERGRVIGVNCRGWDFGGAPDQEPLSSIVPIAHVLPLTIHRPLIPPGSAEERTFSQLRLGRAPTFADLIACGHIDGVPFAS